jgi:hypoxanthine phosphoribosyltransferase
MSITAEEARRVLAGAELLHDEADVDRALDTMAAAITAELADTLPLVLCVMTGGLIPTAKLIARLDFPLELDYLHATRYRGQTRGGELHWLARPTAELRERAVLIIDDILDEGYTLAGIIDECRAQGPRSLHTAVLVEKRHERRYQGLQADFVGLSVDDRYVFGSGMDYKGLLRNLRGIYAARD